MPIPKEPKLKYNIAKYFYTSILLTGIILYVSWGILFGTWFDAGMYAVVVVTVGFGLVGIYLYAHLK